MYMGRFQLDAEIVWVKARKESAHAFVISSFVATIVNF